MACQQRYRWHLEKNATQMAAISWQLTPSRSPSHATSQPFSRTCRQISLSDSSEIRMSCKPVPSRAEGQRWEPEANMSGPMGRGQSQSGIHAEMVGEELSTSLSWE